MKWYVVLLVVIVLLNTPYVKGIIGELIVAILLKVLNKDTYRVYHDLYIEKEDGTTSQIDHVITSLYGIFVVETKNYKGWIFGSEKAKEWTQIVFGTKKKFYNPILQNKGHIKHLSNYLGYTNKTKYHSIITFTGRATLKKVVTTTPVLYSIWLVHTVKKYKVKIIPAERLVEINETLSMIGKATWKTKRQHVADIKSGKSLKPAKVVKNNSKKDGKV